MQQLTPTDPTVLGPYRLAGRLGQGGMGAVYLGVSPTADHFAVKVINRHLVEDPDFVQRFADEVETLRTITGSRVARLEDADIEAETPWLAVEYVPGRSLKEHVELHGALELRSAAMIGAQLIDGLRQIHVAGRLHRDLKPANIMLGRSGPIVIDFGLAVLRDRGDHLTPAGDPVGTPAYMSPEQARGEVTLTEAADVYALGATLVYALTKHGVYPPASPLVTVRRVADPLDLPDVSGVPAELASVIDGMLAYDALARPSLDAVYERLLQVATSGGMTARAVRDLVVAQTFDPSADPIVSLEFDDPEEVVEGETDPDDPARLVRPEDRVKPEQEKVVRQPTDVSWLVEEMRSGYARSATL